MRNHWKAKVLVEELVAGYEIDKQFLKILDHVSFTIHTGELVCLMGPNGAGKSTLLRTICGFQSLTSGNVFLDDKPMAKITNSEQARMMSVVLTEPVSATNLKVKEILMMGRYPYLSWTLRYSSHDAQLVNSAAADCGISNLLNKEFITLSDGQKQKVLIARALVQETPLMILDEPTSHLDLNNRVEIINLLKRITREKGKTIIMATHELDLALQMADRLLLLNSSGSLFQGIPEDLVLNGKLDEVFAFKGYDLKTGKVKQISTGKKVNLIGEGSAYLWTKNALEREGFEVGSESSKTIELLSTSGALKWLFNQQEYQSIEDLLLHLKTK